MELDAENEKRIREILKEIKTKIDLPKLKLYFLSPLELPDRYGECEYKNMFIIRLVRQQFHIMFFSLIHELAHAKAGLNLPDVHGPEWGLAYAAIWRAFLETKSE